MNIFILEDNAERVKWFRRALGGHGVWLTDDVGEAIEIVKARDYQVMFLDHDLDEVHYPGSAGYCETMLRGTGTEFARWLAEHAELSRDARIVIHSCNPGGAARMHDILYYDGGREPILLPFTTLRQLVGLPRLLGLEK